MARLGYLSPGDCPGDTATTAAFIEGLRERGYVVGQNIAIECRYSSEASDEQFRRFAAELVRLPVDVIFAVSSTALRAVRPATSTLPVVALDLETDPVASGVARSLARPGGNITGIFLDALELNGKRLELLRQLVPRLSRVAALRDESMDPAPLRATEAAMQAAGVSLPTIGIRSPKDLDAAMRAAAKERVDAVLVIQSPIQEVYRKTIVDLALQSRLPTIALFPEFVQDGGLMSYGPDVRDLFRYSTSFIERILKGAKAGDIPIERPTRFYLGLNLKTARMLGLTPPQSLLLRTDYLIQ
jgi:putative ABC transport system substrate-binding protein